MASAPDGYTMLFGYNQLVTLNRLPFRCLPCDPDRMTRVGLVSNAPFVMLAPKDLPATTVADSWPWPSGAPARWCSARPAPAPSRTSTARS